MKIISISTDRKILAEGSAVRGRMIRYGKLFDELHIVVSTTRIMNYELRMKLSENVFVYPTNSKNRLSYISDAFKIGRKIIHNSKFITNDSVISTQDPFETGLVGLFLKLFYKLPLQVQVHTDFANRYFIAHSSLNFIRFPLGLFVLSFADSVRCVSERIAKSVRSLSHNVLVLPIVTNRKALSASYERRKNSNKITFLTVARLEKEKDLDTAIRAFKKVLDAGVEAEFVIVGDGSEKDKLINLSRILNLESRIKFVGWKDNTEEYYQNADVYVSTSLYEGYGMSMVEAALHGLPLIISDAGVAGSLFRDGESAFVCRPKDETGFAKAMIRFAQDSRLRLAIGQMAQKTAEQSLYSQDAYLEKYRSSLEQAVQFFNSGHGIFKKNILARYLVAGFTGAGSQIGLLYVLTDIVGIWYLYSSLIAFVVAIVISFLLQKLWTFGDRQISRAHHQFGKYFMVALCGIGINTGFMYFLVDILGLWYILAQIITGAIIAAFNFLMYKFYVFKQ